MIFRKETLSPRTAEESFVAGLRARYAAHTERIRIEQSNQGSQIETSPSGSASINLLDRFFPRIVIGRPGPGQR